MQLAKGA